MEMVLLTAVGVGGATIFGSLIGFLFKKMSHRFSDLILSFAAGVMLSAAAQKHFVKVNRLCHIIVNSYAKASLL